MACFGLGSPKHSKLELRKDKYHVLPAINGGRSVKLLREGMSRKIHLSVCRHLCTNKDLMSYCKNYQFNLVKDIIIILILVTLVKYFSYCFMFTFFAVFLENSYVTYRALF